MTQTALPDASTLGERVRHRLREEHICPATCEPGLACQVPRRHGGAIRQSLGEVQRDVSGPPTNRDHADTRPLAPRDRSARFAQAMSSDPGRLLVVPSASLGSPRLGHACLPLSVIQAKLSARGGPLDLVDPASIVRQRLGRPTQDDRRDEIEAHTLTGDITRASASAEHARRDRVLVISLWRLPA